MQKPFIFVALFVIFLCLERISPSKDVLTTIVATTEGKIQGNFNPQTQTFEFLGIPYASPPIHEKRWKKPFPPTEHFSTVLSCQTLPKMCFQNALAYQDQMSEDCLYLNIYVGLKKPSEPIDSILPVFVFVHGGDFRDGSGNFFNGTDIIQYATSLSLPGFIVVTINYRLGPFGFYALPDLLKEDGKTTGNYGLLDLQIALKWIQANIALFKGAVEKITVVGEGSGGNMALIQSLQTPAFSKDQSFSKIILQSAFLNSSRYVAISLKEAFGQGNNLMQALQCNDLDCLRNIDPVIILQTISGIPLAWVPVVDNYVLEDTVANTVGNGKIKNISMIVGSNRDETGYTICNQLGSANLSLADLSLNLDKLYGILKDKIYTVYNLTSTIGTVYSTPFDALVQITSDQLIHCPAKKLATAFSQQNSNVFLYTFSYAIHAFPPCSQVYLANSTSELPFLFPSYLQDYYHMQYKFSLEEQNLKRDMMRFWIAFASSGDPNYVFPPTTLQHPIQRFTQRKLQQCFFWKYFNNETEVDLKLTIPQQSQMRSNFYTSKCDLWNNLPTYKRPLKRVL